MSSTAEETEPRYYGLEHGVVIDNADPLKLQRVKVRVDGIVDETDWAYPIGPAGGGSKGRGHFDVPAVGSDVCVWFHRGDPHGETHYAPGHWGRGESPVADDVSPEDAPHVKVYETDRFVATFDDRDGHSVLRLEDKKSGDRIEIDGEKRAISVQCTTGIKLQAAKVEIVGAVVTINGRPVAAVGGPI